MARNIQGAGGKKTKGMSPEKTKVPLSYQKKKESKQADLTQKIRNLEDDNKRLILENVTLKNNFDLREIIKALSEKRVTEIDGIETAHDLVKIALKEADEKHSVEIKDMEKKHKKEIEKLSQNLQGEDQIPTKSNPQEVTAGKSEDYLKSLLVEKQQLTKALDKEKTKHAHYINQLEREVESLKAEKNELNSNIKILTMEKESLKKTLREVAGAKLKDELAPQTDLSDPNRPTKLGEKYLELYDYQWTDAFANLSKKYPSASDERLSAYLYDILIDGYRFCQDVRQAQNRSFEEIILYPAGGEESNQRRRNEEIPEIFYKYLSEAAKVSSNVTRVNVVKAFVAKETTKKKYGEIMKLCALYIEECVQLCWQMQIHIPPVCIDLKTVKMESFVADIYNEYTRRGKKIAFVVWPALFLHENGPLLVKGVAQGE